MKNLLCVLFLLATTLSTAQTITVKQDGTGMFTAIQEAIDAAVSGDTILVWPGTYYENLYIEGKNLTLGSLNLTTGDPAYIAQTIIDGNNSGSCIVLWRNITALIQGFTIQHGSGWENGLGTTAGGGIYIFTQCDLNINQCVVQDNSSDAGGGGICCTGSSIFLSGTIIRNNFDRSNSGGIIVVNQQSILASLEFDTVNLCSVYNNFSPKGRDIFYSNDLVPNGFKLDTFTVSNPSRYHVFQRQDNGNADDSVRLSANTYLYESVDEDLFVDPVLGDNANSGLNNNEALKTLECAMLRINNQTNKELTIYLSPGIFSPITNGDKFPLSLRSNVSIVGSGYLSTFLDANYLSNHFRSMVLQNNCSIENLSFINGYGDIGQTSKISSCEFRSDDNLNLDNVGFSNNIGHRNTISIFSCRNTNIIDCEFAENHGGKAIWITSDYYGSDPEKADTVIIKNTVFRHNLPYYDSIIPYGGSLLVKSTILNYNPIHVEVVGCQFTENTTDMNGNFTGSINLYDHVDAVFVNTTIGNNQMINPNTNPIMYIGDQTRVDMRNSVFYGNSPSRIMLSGAAETPSILSISHSLIEGGESAISGDLLNNTLVYDASNIDTDPQWVNYGEFPYALSGISPCIDAGTMDLPEGISLPATDLAGNPRVWGGSVDMGAYEFNPVSIGESRLQPQSNTRLSAMPNPFTHEISITAQLTTAVSVRITVHNLLGREVACLMEQTDNRLSLTSLQWDGRSSTGDILPAGVYLISLSENNKPVASLRVVKE